MAIPAPVRCLFAPFLSVPVLLLGIFLIPASLAQQGPDVASGTEDLQALAHIAPYNNEAYGLARSTLFKHVGWTGLQTATYRAEHFADSPLNPDSELWDVHQALISGSLDQTVGNFQHKVSLYLADESILHDAGNNNVQRFYGVAYSQQFRLRPDHIPFLRVAVQRSDHKGEYPLFEESRDDELFSATLGWLWQINSKLNFNTDITYTDKDSSIEQFSYDRLKYRTGIRYRF